MSDKKHLYPLLLQYIFEQSLTHHNYCKYYAALVDILHKKFNDIHLPLYFQLMMIISVIINYKFRNVWSYDIVNLKKKSTYKIIVEFIIYNYILSLIIYKIKK